MEGEVRPHHNQNEAMGETFAEAFGKIEGGETEQQKEGHKEPIKEVADLHRIHA